MISTNFYSCVVRTGATLASLLLLLTPFSVSAEANLASLLPKSIRRAGVMHVAAGVSQPPLLYLKKDAEIGEGLEIDLTQAIAEVLGVKIIYDLKPFSSLIPTVLSGQDDIAVGSIGDFKFRERQVNFVNYAKVGIGLTTLKGKGDGITGFSSLCGKRVAAIRGSFQERKLNDERAKCRSLGKDLVVLSYPDLNASDRALRSGAVDVMSGASATLRYAVARSGSTLELSGSIEQVAYLGYAINKENKEMQNAIKAALETLQASGKYKEIFIKWEEETSTVDRIVINNAWN
jgi:polar amino acid transport system substrate-binding protein